ncbi:MAG: sugar transferase [Bacteroidetes bacterium]|nr:sugar transferase [Bacteroidota bacterium]
MGKTKERLILLVTDAITLSLGWIAYYLIRVQTGWVDVSIVPDLWMPMVLVTAYWQILFLLVGLYRPWYAASRFDELTLVFKTTLLGCLILFFVIFVDDEGTTVGTSARLLILLYWGILMVCVGSGRLFIRSIQRRMLIAGIGSHNTLIVGSPARSRELYDQVVRYPALGYRISGFVRVEKPERKKGGAWDRGIRILGGLDDLGTIIKREGIREVLIALDSKDHNRLLEIVSKCNGRPVGLKILPDLYDIISGQARTNQIYGFPLIDISPQLMPAWEEAAKRSLDVVVAALVLIAGLPLWLIIGIAIKIDSSGPIIYKQERVGKDGSRFRILKYRSMKADAEKAGPQWAHRRDPRITRVGYVLRRLHLDEIPQLWNILLGHMSLVGPRPERPVFVEKLTKEIPMYPRRLKVRPGITGWAQVKHKYDESIDDVRKKVQYDLFYIENMSLRMDFKILLSTAYHVLLGRGH